MSAGVSIEEPAAQAPYGKFLEHCARGELAYQRSRSGKALFYPRLVDPDGGDAPKWAISSGLGAVYSATIVQQKDAEPFVLALIDLDEGFRMMSRIDTDAPDSIGIGARVKVAFRSLAQGQPVLPVFVVAEGAA